jgi:UDP-2,3-diacylglucosamine hydrolase
MSHKLEILEGAFVVSDAHLSKQRPEFLLFLEDIYKKKLKPTQLILMGDIFDSLFGGIPYTQNENMKAIEFINFIALEIPVIYLEGNHDFNLKNIFPHTKVYSIKQQPVEALYKGKKILLAHGDILSPTLYNLYTSIIRNPITLFVLNILDIITLHLILKRLLNKYLAKKDDCKEFIGFKKYMSKRLENKYVCDYFIEGHFHQNKTIKFDEFNYINLSAFACDQRYFIVKSFQEDINILKEQIF